MRNRHKRLVSALVILLFCVTSALPAHALSTGSPAAPPLPSPVAPASAARANYEALLQGDYYAGELVEEFVALFGDLSPDYVRAHYTDLFDVEDWEIDEGLLAILTNPELRGEGFTEGLTEGLTEEFILWDTDTRRTGGDGARLDPDAFGADDGLDLSFSASPEPEPSAPPVVPATEPVHMDSDPDELSIIEEEPGEEPETPSDGDASRVPAPIADPDDAILRAATSANNGFAGLTYTSKTANSITMSLWYKDSGSANNYLARYDSYAKTWTFILGQGQPAATTRTYTASGLRTAAVYIFEAGAWDAASSSWKTVQITVETAGARTPALTLQSAGNTSFTINATFPSEYAWGNYLKFWNSSPAVSAWTNVATPEYYAKSGVYTVSGLIPGVRYQVNLRFYNNPDGYWCDPVTLYVRTTLPPENPIAYSRSDMTFSLDQWLVNLFDPGRLNTFLDKVNGAYAVEYALVGGAKPFGGAKMGFSTSRTLPVNAEGVSGQPILWSVYNESYPVAPPHVLRMNQKNVSLTETPIHEIGHNFDKTKWTFEAEALTIFKIYDYMKTTNESMVVANQDQIFTGGAGYKSYMKSYANRIQGHIHYDAAMAQGVYSPYSLAYTLAGIADYVNDRQVFKDTFAYFDSLSYDSVPTTAIGKFNLFLSKLKDFSGKDVFTRISAQERAIYEAKLGGTIQYVYGPLSDEQIRAAARAYLAAYYGSGCVLYDDDGVGEYKLPLYDEAGTLIASVLPFREGGTWRGQIIVGATMANPNFFLIDPVTEDYSNIMSYHNDGYKVIYERPLYFCVDESNPGLSAVSALSATSGAGATLGADARRAAAIHEADRGAGLLTPADVADAPDAVLFSEENRLSKLALFEALEEDPLVLASAPNETYALVSESLDQSYVRVQDGGTVYYGGAQRWWNTITPKSGHDSAYMVSAGYGPTAFANVVAYAITQDPANADLKNYTNSSKYISRLPNPLYTAAHFNQTFTLYGSSYADYYFTKADYVNFMDFYADMADLPHVGGTSAIAIDWAFSELQSFTGHGYVKNVPAYALSKDMPDSSIRVWMSKTS